LIVTYGLLILPVYMLNNETIVVDEREAQGKNESLPVLISEE
jgi:hypothetical protein